MKKSNAIVIYFDHGPYDRSRMGAYEEKLEADRAMLTRLKLNCPTKAGRRMAALRDELLLLNAGGHLLPFIDPSGLCISCFEHAIHVATIPQFNL